MTSESSRDENQRARARSQPTAYIARLLPVQPRAAPPAHPRPLVLVLVVQAAAHAGLDRVEGQPRLAPDVPLHSADSVGTAAQEAAAPLARATPILCEAGSVIVFDKDLVHAGAPNLSSAIRYALYARMRFDCAPARNPGE